MKSLVILLEQAADTPRADLEKRTPLAVARCPTAARLVSEGQAGVLTAPRRHARLHPEPLLGMLCGLDEASASRLSRGALEVWSLGIDCAGFTHAYCGQFVTMDDGKLRDAGVERLTFQETEQLATAVQRRFDPARVRLVPRAPGRLVVLVRSSDEDLPYGQSPWSDEAGDLPEELGRGFPLFEEMLGKSLEELGRHAINDVRVDLGENPANAIWLWGGGPLARATAVPLRLKFFTQSAMAAGLARVLGAPAEPLLDPWLPAPPSAIADPEAVRGWLADCDRLIIYVEAPPAFASGDGVEKARLLERIDFLLIQPLLDAMRRVKQRRVLLASVAHSADVGGSLPHPVALWGSHIEPDSCDHWDEEACRAGTLTGRSPADLALMLLGDEKWR